MNEEDYGSSKRPVDKGYSMLVSAMRHEAKKLVGEDEEVAEQLVIRGASNTAWMVMRVKNAEMPLWLLHGYNTVKARAYSVTVAKEGAGFEISYVPFDAHVFDAMELLLKLDQQVATFCACGHKYDLRPAKHKELGHEIRLAVCPSCGYADGGDAWEEL